MIENRIVEENVVVVYTIIGAPDNVNTTVQLYMRRIVLNEGGSTVLTSRKPLLRNI